MPAKTSRHADESECADRAGQHEDLRQSYQVLAKQHVIEVRLAEALSSGRNLGELFSVISSLSGRPMWLLDAKGSVVTSSHLPADFRVPELVALLENARLGMRSQGHVPVFVDSMPQQGLARRHVIAEVVNEDIRVGWLVIAEHPTRFGQFDKYLAARAALYLSRHHHLHRAVRQSISDLASDLAGQLLKGTYSSNDLRHDAGCLGVNLDTDKMVVCIDDSAVTDGIGSAASIAQRMSVRVGCDVIGTRTGSGLALIVEADVEDGYDDEGSVNRLKQAVLALVPKYGVQVGISGIRSSDDLTDAYSEASEVVSCLDRFPAAHSRVITVRDLGPARVLVANGNIGSIRRYVRQTLGPLWDGGPDDQALLNTLAAFARSGHNVRRTAQVIAVHENTVRLRIAKVRKLTGLDVLTDPSAQLAVHTALTIVMLRSRPHPVTDGGDFPRYKDRGLSGRTA